MIFTNIPANLFFFFFVVLLNLNTTRTTKPHLVKTSRLVILRQPAHAEGHGYWPWTWILKSLWSMADPRRMRLYYTTYKHVLLIYLQGSLIPRLLPVFQCHTQKIGGAWYLIARDFTHASAEQPQTASNRVIATSWNSSWTLTWRSQPLTVNSDFRKQRFIDRNSTLPILSLYSSVLVMCN